MKTCPGPLPRLAAFLLAAAALFLPPPRLSGQSFLPGWLVLQWHVTTSAPETHGSSLCSRETLSRSTPRCPTGGGRESLMAGWAGFPLPTWMRRTDLLNNSCPASIRS